MIRRMLMPAVVLAAAVALPAAAVAEQESFGRGNVVSIDKAAHTIELKDPKGRVATWNYDPSATVKFEDGASLFPNPTPNDLRSPMYVHYTFKGQTIDSFIVEELGFNPAQANSPTQKTPGQSRTVTGRVTAYDPKVQQVEIDENGQRETFQLTERSNQRFQVGDQVQLNTAWHGDQELVASAKVVGHGSQGPGNTGYGSNSGYNSGTLRRGGSSTGNLPASGSSAGDSAQGQVVRVTSRGVVLQVAGTQQTYGVDNPQLLQRLRVGDTVQFSWRTDNNGRMYITNIQ